MLVHHVNLLLIKLLVQVYQKYHLRRIVMQIYKERGGELRVERERVERERVERES